jgi:hypothetical protein
MALASSSRSQVLTQPARAGSGVTSGRSSIGVRWRPRLAVVIVTQLVTRTFTTLAFGRRLGGRGGGGTYRIALRLHQWTSFGGLPLVGRTSHK